MEEVKEKKQKLRKEMEKKLALLPEAEILSRTDRIESQLFEFANFEESNVALFYFMGDNTLNGGQILHHCSQMRKAIILPSLDGENRLKVWKVENLLNGLKPGKVLFDPDPERCKPVTFDTIDIAIVQGVAFDEKGGRLGSGRGLYDRLAAKLPNTVRKVALAIEEQIISHVPMESNDKFVDIIITDKRIIYKI